MPELDLLDLEDRPFRWRMGLKPLEPATWILVDERYDHDLAEKRRLLRERHGEVVATLPGTEAAAAEVLHALEDHLVATFPERFGRASGEVVDPRTGEPVVERDGALHPIEHTGRLVQEDLCLHTMVDGLLVLSAASVCFPTRWRLGEKLGRPVLAIHAPVPGYALQVGRGVDRVLDQLGEQGVWRTNWSVLDDPAMFQPGGHDRPSGAGDEAITAANAGERLWLRFERQTLRRFPGHDSVLFTIRVFVRPFADLVHRPDVATRLAAAVRRLPPEVARYKRVDGFADAAVGWLERAAS